MNKRLSSRNKKTERESGERRGEGGGGGLRRKKGNVLIDVTAEFVMPANINTF